MREQTAKQGLIDSIPRNQKGSFSCGSNFRMLSPHNFNGRASAACYPWRMSPRDKNIEPTLHDVMDVLHTMNGRMDNIDERLGEVSTRLSKVETGLEDVKETLDAVAQAVDKDSVTLVSHSRRLAKLEQAPA